jgi:recombination protein RecA
LLDMGVLHSAVEKSGSWFSYKGERIGQGRENARQYLRDHNDMLLRLDTELRGILKLSPKEVQPTVTQ